MKLQHLGTATNKAEIRGLSWSMEAIACVESLSCLAMFFSYFFEKNYTWLMMFFFGNQDQARPPNCLSFLDL